MIDEKEIKKLADLSRINIDPEEIRGFQKDIDSILQYVGQIKEVSLKEKITSQRSVNILRDDSFPHDSGFFSEDLLDRAPKREGDYFKVKKILAGDSDFEI